MLKDGRVLIIKADGDAWLKAEIGLEDIPDIELPGMWERADFTGGNC